MTYELNPIGSVELGEQGFAIRVHEGVKTALLGLEEFSHIQVYWWADQLDQPQMRSMTTVPQPYRKAPEHLGIFATRSPLRPNPILMTLVQATFVDLEHGLVGLAYIDAEPGSPVLDIKPYYGMERVRDYHVPTWCSHWPQWYEDAGTFDWEGEFVNAR
jgi:tRNA (Thr-GGU) A37 N-methylase